jgi:hypothetical protein
MEEKTKKKRVEKRAVSKKAKVAEPIAAAAAPVAVETRKPRKISKPKSKSSQPRSTMPLPTFEQVQLRAYFISEHRRKLGQPGNEHHDWITAEQELRAELTV